jgi:EmrB/QacA subfamily drug resistance transporter
MAVASPAAPLDRPAPRQNVRIVFLALVLVMLLAALDQTIVSTALPTIVSELGGLAHLTWVVTSYLLATTVVSPLYAKLGDLYGRKVVLQTAIVLFLAGSMLCGQSRSMEHLILFRVLQGLGGGGLMVTTTAVVADLVPPRERGRYQGIFGAVFAVATLIGPLAGGFFVQHLTWRWIFYVNLPFGVLALAVIASTFTRPTPGVVRRRARIDYGGAALLATALSCLVLLTSLGGQQQMSTWRSPLRFGLLLLGLFGLLAFVMVERKAPQPLLPLSLFRNGVFVTAGLVGFVVGLTMFGAVTYLPLYLQVVRGASPARSGLQLAPLMGGMLVTSVLSGRLITRFGRYKPFPIVGMALTTVALTLVARLEAGTTSHTITLHMLLLGLGLGMVMQVLVLAVQNSVSYENLGVATSGATLFRFMGGALGLSLFGALFTSELHALTAVLPGGGDLSTLSPTAVAHLPDTVRQLYLQAFVHALRLVFACAATAALLGFVATLFLPSLPLRRTVAANALDDGFAMPRGGDSLDELERAVTRLAQRENHWGVYQRLGARARLDLSPQEIWFLARVGEQAPVSCRALGHSLRLEPADCSRLIDSLEDRHLVASTDHGEVRLRDEGRLAIDRLIAARRQLLAELLEGWSPEKHAEVRQLLDRLARALTSELPVRPAVA